MAACKHGWFVVNGRECPECKPVSRTPSMPSYWQGPFVAEKTQNTYECAVKDKTERRIGGLTLSEAEFLADLLNKYTPDEDRNIVITVEGGAVQDVQLPEGWSYTLKDYDDNPDLDEDE